MDSAPADELWRGRSLVMRAMTRVNGFDASAERCRLPPIVAGAPGRDHGVRDVGSGWQVPYRASEDF